MRSLNSLSPKAALPFALKRAKMAAKSTSAAVAAKESIVVIMGATGTGKSRLSIDIATRFKGEIINADKMQVYRGLDIATNKVPVKDRKGIRHHLLGEYDSDADITARDFSDAASKTIADVISRRKLPIVVGGSNSYIQALVLSPGHSRERPNFRYDCCFIWVDVQLEELYDFVSRRVDEMVDAGLTDEVAGFFDPDKKYDRGIRKAIGVPEFDRYLRDDGRSGQESSLLQDAIQEVKENTCKLARKQRARIEGLRLSGWDLNHIDATPLFQALSGPDPDQIWRKTVLKPCIFLVEQFLKNQTATTASFSDLIQLDHDPDQIHIQTHLHHAVEPAAAYI